MFFFVIVHCGFHLLLFVQHRFSLQCRLHPWLQLQHPSFDTISRALMSCFLLYLRLVIHQHPHNETVRDLIQFDLVFSRCLVSTLGHGSGAKWISTMIFFETGWNSITYYFLSDFRRYRLRITNLVWFIEFTSSKSTFCGFTWKRRRIGKYSSNLRFISDTSRQTEKRR